MPNTAPFVPALVLLALASPSDATETTCAAADLILASGNAEHRFEVRVADTTRERAYGLAGASDLGPGTGMLFVYPGPRSSSLFVNTTELEVDILSFSADGQELNRRAWLDANGMSGGADMLYAVMVPGGTLEAISASDAARIVDWTCKESD